MTKRARVNAATIRQGAQTALRRGFLTVLLGTLLIALVGPMSMIALAASQVETERPVDTERPAEAYVRKNLTEGPIDLANCMCDRILNAGFVRDLLLGTLPGFTTPPAYTIRGARVAGKLWLSNAVVPGDLRLIGWTFDDRVDADGTTFRTNVAILGGDFMGDVNFNHANFLRRAAFDSYRCDNSASCAASYRCDNSEICDVSSNKICDIEGNDCQPALEARFRRDTSFAGATVGEAFSATRATFFGEAHFDRLTAKQGVDLSGAWFGGGVEATALRAPDLNAIGAEFHNSQRTAKFAAVARWQTRLATDWASLRLPKASQSQDPAELELDGLSYRAITGGKPSDWRKLLGDKTRFNPSVYQTFETSLQQQGEAEEARKTFIARRGLAAAREQSWLLWLWQSLVLRFLGYGRDLTELLLLCLGVFIFAWILFSWGVQRVGRGFVDCAVRGLTYALDAILPLDLHLKNWATRDTEGVIGTAVSPQVATSPTTLVSPEPWWWSDSAMLAPVSTGPLGSRPPIRVWWTRHGVWALWRWIKLRVRTSWMQMFVATLRATDIGTQIFGWLAVPLFLAALAGLIK